MTTITTKTLIPEVSEQDVEYKNAVYSRLDQTSIDLDVKHPILGWRMFTITEADYADIWDAVNNGDVAPFPGEELDTEIEGGVNGQDNEGGVHVTNQIEGGVTDKNTEERVVNGEHIPVIDPDYPYLVPETNDDPRNTGFE